MNAETQRRRLEHLGRMGHMVAVSAAGVSLLDRSGRTLAAEDDPTGQMVLSVLLRDRVPNNRKVKEGHLPRTDHDDHR